MDQARRGIEDEPRYECRKCSSNIEISARRQDHIFRVRVVQLCTWPGCGFETDNEIDMGVHLDEMHFKPEPHTVKSDTQSSGYEEDESHKTVLKKLDDIFNNMVNISNREVEIFKKLDDISNRIALITALNLVAQKRIQ